MPVGDESHRSCTVRAELQRFPCVSSVVSCLRGQREEDDKAEHPQYFSCLFGPEEGGTQDNEVHSPIPQAILGYSHKVVFGNI